MKNLLSFSIVISIIVFTSFSVSSVVKRIITNSEQVYYAASLFSHCEPIDQSFNQKKIVLRIDDIQAYGWQDIQIQMMDDALKQDVPLLLGVIPKQLKDDKELYYFLKRNSCNLEIAQHGWDHNITTGGETPEFGNLTEEEAYQRIIKGKLILEKLVGGSLTTFIPPNNEYSEGTFSALNKIGFKIISSGGNEFFDYTTSTYNFDKETLTPISDVISECQEGLDKNDLCIIMIHPQDYATDGELDEVKYNNYTELLGDLKELNVSFVKLEDLSNPNLQKSILVKF